MWEAGAYGKAGNGNGWKLETETGNGNGQRANRWRTVLRMLKIGIAQDTAWTWYSDFGRPCNRRLRMRSQLPQILKLCIIRWTVFCEMSCEPRRTSAYSEDLRWRMVWQKEVLGLSYKEIGNHLNVDPSTVCRTVHIFHQTGGVSKRKYPRERACRKLTKSLELYILHLVLNRPGIYLRELATNLLHTTRC